ncbi:hypothetical protein HDV02_001636 [Globomyces sp. JEL0801]|nr:hypothetical protein HDV02_001636 [Globomyces sp. JEL0801]
MSLKAIMGLAVLSAAVEAQICSTGKTIDAFKTCLDSALTTPDGKTGARSAEEACQSLKAVAWSYFGCLCSKTKLVVGCYTNNCAGDPAMPAYQGSQASYCSSADANPPPQGQNVPGSPKPTTTTTGLAPIVGALPGATTTPKSSASNTFSTVMVFGEILLMSMLANML